MASGPPFPQPPSPFEPGPSPYGSPAAAQPEYGWLAPASLPGAQGGAFPGSPGGTAMYDLRPLSTGEVLDRTFSLYRSRFLLFTGIASLSSLVQMVGHGLQLIAQHYLLRRGNLLTMQFTTMGIALIVAVLFFLAFAVTQAATVYAMSEVYMGRDTTVGDSLRATAGKWYRYVGVGIWQVGSAAWLPLGVLAVFGGLLALGRNTLGGIVIGLLSIVLIFGVLGAYVVGFILYLRNALAIPALVVERLTVRPAMRRSKVLSGGAKGKVFLILLLCGVLYGVVGGITAVLNIMGLMHVHLTTADIIEQVFSLLVIFAGYALVSPVMMIGSSLVYFDQRVRKEAFDVAVLLGEDVANPLGTARMFQSETPAPGESPAFVVAAAAVSQPAAAAETLESPAAEATSLQATDQERAVKEPEGGVSGL